MIFKVVGWDCPGRVYPTETVDRIANAIQTARVGRQAQGDELWRLVAVAVLDAINEDLT